MPIEDEELMRHLSERLQRSPWQADFLRVVVTVHRQQITLSGVVHSFHLKQIAQTLILREDKQKSIKNNLKVLSPHSELRRPSTE